MTYYQNQLNMAVFLATAGCGVSVNDHLKHKDPFVASSFITYYQIRKILKQMGCTIPTIKISTNGTTGFTRLVIIR
jgi:hypothetical protein